MMTPQESPDTSVPPRAPTATTTSSAVDLYASGEYLQKVPTWHVEESAGKVREIVSLLERHHLVPARIGDVGCGAGEVLRLLQLHLPAAVDFVGYDIAAAALTLAAQRANDHLHFVHAALPTDPTEHFDVLMALDVVEHVEDYFAFLRALRPRGDYKIFYFPMDLSVQTVIRPYGLLQKRDAYGHLHYFTKETAVRALTDTGYEVLESRYTGDMLDLPTRLIGRNLIKHPRKLVFAVNQDFAVHLLGGYRLLVLAR